jgi:hypothetical protein
MLVDEDFTAAHKLAFDMYVADPFSFSSVFLWLSATCF